jgi:lipoate-protein ligase A
MTAMPRTLHVFRDPSLDGPTNMARDEHLLYSEEFRPAAIRIYAWEPPTISLGCFQRYSEIAKLPDELRSLAVVRRPTGGGAILHDREVTYCLVVDNSLPVARQAPTALYLLAHEAWRAALGSDGQPCEMAPEDLPFPSPRSGPFFCFQKPGRTDLIVGGDKLLGSAQRRIPGRVLQHGSLLLGRRFAAHPGADLGNPDPKLVEGWIEGFIAPVASALALGRRPGEWKPAHAADIDRRRQHFASETWTRRH